MPRFDSIFGPVVSRRDVAQAVISHLQSWMPDTLAEIERQEGLAAHTIPVPPDDDSWKIGLDYKTWTQPLTPCLIVVVKPLNPPERYGGGGTYTVEMAIEIASIVQGDDEDDALALADWYASAVRLAVFQHGSLGTWTNGDPVSTKTVMTQFQETTFPYPNSEKGRRVVCAVVGAMAVISNVLIENDGPSVPSQNPYNDPGNWPEVSTVTTTITPESLTES